MYKLFLCLRYLWGRPIAYLAVLSVTICVFLMIATASVMNGFLNKIEVAAKGLFGDIIVEPRSQAGMPYYDELIRAIENGDDELEVQPVPGVESASPFIVSYGFLQVPDQNYRQPIQIAGIRLPERNRATDFEEGLFVQEGNVNAVFTPNIRKVVQAVREDKQRILALAREETEGYRGTMTVESMLEYTGGPPEQLNRQVKQTGGKPLPAELLRFLQRIRTAVSLHDQAIYDLIHQEEIRKDIQESNRRIIQLQDAYNQAETDEAAARIEQQLAVQEQMTAQLRNRLLGEADKRIILGLGIQGLSFRTPEGRTVRYLVPGHNVALYVFPIGQRGTSVTNIEPRVATMTVIDDASTDVHSIDTQFVYVPFDTLQRLNGMEDPKRCSQVHIKVSEGVTDERTLRAIAQRVDRVWSRMAADPARYPGASQADVSVQTWRQKQRKLIAPLEAQRTLSLLMFGLMAGVVVILIFVILYIIVVQKTPDIGVLKALGASNLGVAGIFLAYGAVIGLVGSIFGSLLGWAFVHNINPIHDGIGRLTGVYVWSKETYLFNKIPNEVQLNTVLWIGVAAVCSGVIGAAVPAMRAGRLQPVEALRYE
ncbi:MAG: ABC transporter permease [Phycisphaerae bacterium]